MRASRRRVATALLASYWLLSALAGAVHGGLGGHTYCAEHRTFEEGSKAVGGVAPGGSDSATLEPGGSAEHAECPFAESLRPRAVSTSENADPGLALLHVTPAPIRLPDAPPAAVPLLLTAPKSSPPIA